VSALDNKNNSTHFLLLLFRVPPTTLTLAADIIKEEVTMANLKGREDSSDDSSDDSSGSSEDSSSDDSSDASSNSDEQQMEEEKVLVDEHRNEVMTEDEETIEIFQDDTDDTDDEEVVLVDEHGNEILDEVELEEEIMEEEGAHEGKGDNDGDAATGKEAEDGNMDQAQVGDWEETAASPSADADYSPALALSSADTAAAAADDWEDLDTSIKDIHKDRDPEPHVDLENQAPAATASRRAASHAVPEQAPTKATKSEKGRGAITSCLCLVCILVCLGVGLGLGLGLYRNNEDDDDKNDYLNRGITEAPSASPTGIGEFRTTGFDSIQFPKCDISALSNPHVVDQCACNGVIETLAEDIRARYAIHLASLATTIYENVEEEIQSCTPRNQALVWLSTANDFEFSQFERIQRFTLATVFVSLNGAEWSRKDDWMTEEASCNWKGVTCNKELVVTSLKVEKNNASGVVRIALLLDFASVCRGEAALILICVCFVSQLPREVALLDGLTSLSLSGNEVTGGIPVELFAIEGLEIVDFSFNNFTGNLPLQVGQALSLVSFNVEANQLNGRLSTTLGDATMLERLNLGSNKFAGEIPLPILTLPALIDLRLHDNALTGTIPADISQASLLTSLTLGPNLFTGTIQRSISELTNLKYLSMRGIAITGRLPGSYALNLQNLVELEIADTNVDGNIPTFFGDLPNLVKLDFSGNKLRNEITPELGNLPNLRK
jgi:hypothetical protein